MIKTESIKNIVIVIMGIIIVYLYFFKDYTFIQNEYIINKDKPSLIKEDEAEECPRNISNIDVENKPNKNSESINSLTKLEKIPINNVKLDDITDIDNSSIDILEKQQILSKIIEDLDKSDKDMIDKDIMSLEAVGSYLDLLSTTEIIEFVNEFLSKERSEVVMSNLMANIIENTEPYELESEQIFNLIFYSVSFRKLPHERQEKAMIEYRNDVDFMIKRRADFYNTNQEKTWVESN